MLKPVKHQDSHRNPRVLLAEMLEPRVLLSGDGRPTGTLYASPIYLWGSTYSFKVTYTDNTGIDPATLGDRNITVNGPDGFSRPARFYRWVEGPNGSMSAWYKISAPAALWDARDNGSYQVWLNAFQVRDIDGNSARQGELGRISVAVPDYPTTVVAGQSGVGIGIDVTRFGAIPNDGMDDTGAIQRAIDSLPRDGDGVPDAENVSGGFVVFPAGIFETSRPLRIPSGVRLGGQGSATIIANSSSDANSAAIELVSYAGHGFNIRAGVENLTLTTVTAKGIKPDPSLSGDLISLRLNNVKISAGGVAIDLRAIRTYAADIRNVIVENPGSGAMWLGKQSDWSAVNHVYNFSVVGTLRANFRPERAMVVIEGDSTVEGLTIDTSGSLLPLHVTNYSTIRHLSILGSGSAPGGVIARFENAFIVDVDRLRLGEDRRLDVRNSRNIRVQDVNVSAGSTLQNSVMIDPSSHLTVQTLRSPTQTMFSNSRQITVGAIGFPDADPPRIEVFAEPQRPLSLAIVDVSRFGAIPDDGRDDTVAIQRAIDALPKGNGVPALGSAPVGGLVLFPPGKFNTRAPIQVPSGVWLRGHGHATVINNADRDPSRAAIEFVSQQSHGYNVGAAVEEIGIHTLTVAGVRAHESITAGLVDLRITGVQISAGGRAIDLSPARTYHANISNVMISIPGSAGLVLGDDDGYSADNRVTLLQFQGSARPDFIADRALVMLNGEYSIHNMWIEHPAVRALPLLASGQGTFRGLWLEYPDSALPDGVVALVENATRVEFDRLLHILPSNQLHVVNSQNVSVGFLSIDGATTPLRETISVDQNSFLSVGAVSSQIDSGLLDHPRVRVESAYNARDRIILQNRVPDTSENLLADPDFRSLGPPIDEKLADAVRSGSWTITWGDQLGGVVGYAVVEESSKGPRLKIVITSNPNNRYVTVAAKVNVPSALVGQYGVARWRLDGPGQALVYNHGLMRQYSARTMNSTTSARTPTPTQASEQLIFVLPPSPGTYYLSQVSLAALGT